MMHVVTRQYFEAMGIGLRRGRLFADTDSAGAPLVAIVDDALARRWWQTEEAAIGQRIRVGEGEDAQVRTVVGVVRRVSHNQPGASELPTLYAPQAQVYQRGMYTVIETSEPPASIFDAARAALAAVDPSVPLYFAGARMVGFWPVSIVGQGLGVNITVESYAGTLGFGVIAASSAVREPRQLADGLLATHEQLLRRCERAEAA